MLSISSSCNFLLHRRLSLLIGESYRFVVGVASIGVGGGAWGSRRCFYSSNSSNYNNKKNVSKIWAASILGEEAKEAKQKNNYTKSTLLGLGEASSTQDLKGLLVKGHEERVEGDNRKGQTKESNNNNNNSRGGKTTKGVYRRRMTDSTWTTMPMDDKLIWVDCEVRNEDAIYNLYRMLYAETDNSIELTNTKLLGSTYDFLLDDGARCQFRDDNGNRVHHN
jgi:hypothetical protein